MYTDGYYLFYGDIKLLIELHYKGTWLPLARIVHCSCFKVWVKLAHLFEQFVS